MKPSILPLFLFLILMFFSCEENPKEESDNRPPKEKGKYLTEIWYFDERHPEIDTFKYASYHYDEKLYLEKVTSYSNSDPSQYSTHAFEYNQDGRLITIFKKNIEDDVSWKETIEYPDEFLIYKESFTQNDNGFEFEKKTRIILDIYARPIEKRFSSDIDLSFDSISFVESYRYNASGQLVTFTLDDGMGWPNRTTISYDNGKSPFFNAGFDIVHDYLILFHPWKDFIDYLPNQNMTRFTLEGNRFFTVEFEYDDDNWPTHEAFEKSHYFYFYSVLE